MELFSCSMVDIPSVLYTSHGLTNTTHQNRTPRPPWHHPGNQYVHLPLTAERELNHPPRILRMKDESTADEY